ncbi:MAG: hypothetical protein GY943_00505 [Chloroflexi bacterium]|nr:hypothetical protein [Chloroflexota bacterium]
MRFIGSTEFDSPQPTVWSYLTNPTKMAACLPGVKQWQMIEPEKSFDLLFHWPSNQSHDLELPVQLMWTEQNAPTYLALKAITEMGSQQLTATGNFTLTAHEHNKTAVSFSVDVTTPNKMLDRMVHTAVPKLANAFFTCLKNDLENENS